MLMGWTEASWADDVNTWELAERRAQPISKPVESAEKEKKLFAVVPLIIDWKFGMLLEYITMSNIILLAIFTNMAHYDSTI